MPVTLRIIVYPIFAIVTFLFFVAMLFPVESIKTRIELEAERGMGGQYDVVIQDMSMALLSGINLEKVSILQRGAEKDPIFKLDEAELQFEMLPLLWGSVRVAFDLNIGKSSIVGKVARNGSDLELAVNLDKLNIADFPLLRQRYGLDLSSDIDGDIDMEIFPNTPLRNNGSVLINIKSLKMGESNIMNIFPMPPMTLATPNGQSNVDLVMNRGNIEIREMDLRGGDLDLAINGKVFLAQRVSNFRFNLTGKLGFSESLADSLPALAIIAQQKDADGLYPLSITGRFSKPSIKVGEFKLPL